PGRSAALSPASEKSDGAERYGTSEGCTGLNADKRKVCGLAGTEPKGAGTCRLPTTPREPALIRAFRRDLECQRSKCLCRNAAAAALSADPNGHLGSAGSSSYRTLTHSGPQKYKLKQSAMRRGRGKRA